MSGGAYLEAVFCIHAMDDEFDRLFGNGWQSLSSVQSIFASDFDDFFRKYGFEVPQKCQLRDDLFDHLLENGGFEIEGDEYTGEYGRLVVPKKDSILAKIRGQSTQAQRLDKIGEAAFGQAIANSARELGWRASQDANSEVLLDDEESESIETTDQAPAADRIVTLQHNQIAQIENPLEQVVKLVESENTIDGEDGLRELVLGRLRAGLELVKAGIFSLRSLQLTLIVGLQMLVERFKDHAIGAVAGNLLALLIKELGL